MLLNMPFTPLRTFMPCLPIKVARFIAPYWLPPGVQKIPLGWMRSSEIAADAFVKPITSGDAWAYSEAFTNTPLKYFTNTNAQDAANSNVSENVLPLDEQVVGAQYIWDEGLFFDTYKSQNGSVAYDWASWMHFGNNESNYSIRRFSAYIDLDKSDFSADSMLLAPED